MRLKAERMRSLDKMSVQFILLRMKKGTISYRYFTPT